MASETNSHTPRARERRHHTVTGLPDREEDKFSRERDVGKDAVGGEGTCPWWEKDSWPGIAEIGEWKTVASLFSFHCCRFGAFLVRLPLVGIEKMRTAFNFNIKAFLGTSIEHYVKLKKENKFNKCTFCNISLRTTFFTWQLLVLSKLTSFVVSQFIVSYIFVLSN